MRIRESELISIIRRTINESQLITEGPKLCAHDGMCTANPKGSCKPLKDNSPVGVCCYEDRFDPRSSTCNENPQAKSELAYDSTRAMNESNLLLEKPGCSDDDECAQNAVCSTKARDGDGACVPICRKGRKGDGCKPLSVVNNSPKKEIDERGREVKTPVGGKWYCVMKGRGCWELDERDPSAKGNKGYRREKRCNKNC